MRVDARRSCLSAALHSRVVVKAILFDLDGTLWDRDGAVSQLVQAQHRQFAELSHIPQADYVDRVVELDAHGFGDKREVYRQVASEFDLPPELATILHDDFWASYHLFYQPFPEVIPTLLRLAAEGLKLGIITNGKTAIQQAKIDGLGLGPLMDTILISEHEGVRKPDRAIFERALQRLGVTAEESWFVGDHPDADVRGAKEAGLTAVWRRSWTEAPNATHPISSLDELLPLVIAASHPNP
jgi:putative hydrolase of the HAD superfamily